MNQEDKKKISEKNNNDISGNNSIHTIMASRRLQDNWSETLMTPIPVIPRFYKIHMIGVGGSGMCGIAEVLLSMGYRVIGSDIKESVATERLLKLGASVFIGHDGKNIDSDTDVIVFSSAIKEDNPEMVVAKERRIPLIRRAEMLAELIRYSYGITVAGAHGKTTTTTLITSIFSQHGFNPSYIVGGRVMSSEGESGNARFGKSRYLIAEADESDASFRHIHPIITVVTNIDMEHMESYNNDFDEVKNAYIDFIHNIPFYGLAVLCQDDKEISSIIPKVHRKIITYGESDTSDYHLHNIEVKGLKTHFSVRKRDKSIIELELNLPGIHNAMNATAAVAVACEEKISDKSIQEALKNFAGVGRRFNVSEIKGDRNISLVNDYGHHPRELGVTIDTARKVFPNRRICMVFQPHRFSRTKQLFYEFVSVLEGVDSLIVQQVYSAGEKGIPGFFGEDICNSLRTRGKIEPIFCEDNQQTVKVLSASAQDGDVILVQGAGDVGSLPDMLMKDFPSVSSK